MQLRFKRAILLSLFSIPLVTLNARDCLLEFQTSFESAEDIYKESHADCVLNETVHEYFCLVEAEYDFSNSVGLAAKKYDDCTTANGGG